MVHENWEKLKSQPKPDIDKISFFTFESYLWTLLATKDSENKLGLRIQFEEISNQQILKTRLFEGSIKPSDNFTTGPEPSVVRLQNYTSVS